MNSNCSFTKEIFEEFGLSSFDKMYVSDIFRLITPELLLLTIATVSYYLCRKVHIINIKNKRDLIYNENKPFNKNTTFTDHFCPLKNIAYNSNNLTLNNDVPGTSHSFANDDELTDNFKSSDVKHDKLINYKHSHKSSPLERFFNIIFPILSELIFLTFLFASSCMWPSILSLPYLVLFLFIFAKWTFSKPIANNQMPIKIFLIFYIALHLLTYYLYQLKLFQMYLPSDDLIARLMGISSIVYSKCEQPGHLYINNDIKWQQITLPFILFIFYWLIALEISYFRNGINIFSNNSFLTNESFKSDDLTNIKIREVKQYFELNFNSLYFFDTNLYHENKIKTKKFVFRMIKIKIQLMRLIE